LVKSAWHIHLAQSFFAVERAATRLAAVEITPSVGAYLSTAASRLVLWLNTGGCGQKLLPTVVAAKIKRLSLAFGVQSSCLVHGHSADGVFGRGFRFFHGHVPFLVVVTVGPASQKWGDYCALLSQ
jgi:hypothetical protein